MRLFESPPNSDLTFLSDNLSVYVMNGVQRPRPGHLAWLADGKRVDQRYFGCRVVAEKIIIIIRIDCWPNPHSQTIQIHKNENLGQFNNSGVIRNNAQLDNAGGHFP